MAVVIDADKVTNLMVAQSLKQYELALKAGVSRPTLSALLNKGRCHHTTAVKIATALKVSTKEIVVGNLMGSNKIRLNSFNIKILLAEQQKNASDLAKDLGVSRQCISETLIRGNCELKTAEKIAKALGVPIREIAKEE
ncbi:MAG: helix-turn-helix domain-containing protein [Clostridia bacterium]|nr:helix-turn-helix domain-containing protein [Clostridia bacterium]